MMLKRIADVDQEIVSDEFAVTVVVVLTGFQTNHGVSADG